MSNYNFYDKLEMEDAVFNYKERTYIPKEWSEEESPQWQYLENNDNNRIAVPTFRQ